jgi:hypothetical protein
MSPWLKNHFQTDEVPDFDILDSALKAAHKVTSNQEQFPKADFATLYRLIEEIENDQDCIWTLTTPAKYRS